MSNLIYQQIPKVMAELSAIGKDNRNQQQGYNFRGIDDVYNELHPLLTKHKIFSTTNVIEQKREERPSKNGGILTYSILTIKFTFFAEDGSFVEVTTVGEGMDSGDKSSNKAMAIAHKYALTQLFAIPTVDDKDPDAHSPQPAQRQQLPPPTTKKETPGSYIVKIGTKCKNKAIKDCKPEDLNNLANYLEENAADTGKPLTGDAKEFLQQYIAYMESVR